MKKILAVVLSVVMMLSVGTLLTSAAFVEGVDFKEAGEFEITWDTDAASKLTFDGDLSDWVAAGYNIYTVDMSNMVLFDNVTPNNMPENFSINAYYVSDRDYLYVAFHIVDDKFAYGNSAGGYNGDAFQIAIDFNNELKTLMAEDPDAVTNPQNIFYSFCCIEDGVQLQIMRQNSDNDALLDENPTTDAADDSIVIPGIKGAAKKTEGGWDAEFALSWEMLYRDFAYKAFIDQYKAALDRDHDLTLGITLCYLNRDEDCGGITGAAGTFNSEHPTWTPAENGMSLRLKWKQGVALTCAGIVTPEGDAETVAEEALATEAKTEAPTEAKTEGLTEALTEDATQAAATELATEAGTEAGTEAAAGGCASAIGASVALILTAMAAAVALKKH